MLDLILQNTSIIGADDGFNKIIEEENGEKRTYISGPFIVMDKKNGNNRIYGSKETIPAVEKYKTDWVHSGRAMGELNHPGTPRVNPERACIKIVELNLNEAESIYYGKAKVLKTNLGILVDTLLKDDVVLGVSSRMAGSVDPHTNRVNAGLRVVTGADVVTDPSNAEAIVQCFQEHKDYLSEYGIGMEQAVDEFSYGLATKGSTSVDSILQEFLIKVEKLV